MEGSKQQATSLDVERQPGPVGGGTTGSGRGRRRRAWTEEELARYAVQRRREYLLSLLGTIWMPIITLVLFIGPFLVTSWTQDVRITWWLVAFLFLFVSFHCFRSHDRDYGYHPEVVTQSGADHC